MSALFRFPFDAILDTDIHALAGGTIAFYDPETLNLATVYLDDGLTIPAINPVVLDSVGEPEQGAIYLGPQDYRIIVRTAEGAVIPNGDVDPIHGLGVGSGTSSWASILPEAQAMFPAAHSLHDGQTMTVAGRASVNDGYGGVFVYKAGDAVTTFPENGLGFVDAAGRRWFRQFDEAVNLRWFGALGDGGNDSAAAQAAFNTGHPVYVPAGTWAFNVNAIVRVRVFGVGSATSKIRPYDTAVAAITLTNTTADWSMPYVFDALGFYGPAALTGIGVAYGKTDPADYVAGDELIGRVTFNNCYFRDLEKGIQRTFGNIGLYLNQTSFQKCYYGTYNLNNKQGISTAPMHAGGFNCFGGSSIENKCGHYFHCGGQIGIGQIEFDGHIFELNVVGFYSYVDYMPNTGYAFRSCWVETNGAQSPGNPTTIVLDTWSGTTKATASLAAHAFVFEGAYAYATFRDGHFHDVHLKASHSQIVSQNDRAESETASGGLPCVVDDQETSRIIIRDPIMDRGSMQVPGTMVEGVATQADPSFGFTGSGGRANLIPFRQIMSTRNIAGVNNACQTIAAGAADFSGAKAITAVLAASEGSHYADAAQYTESLTSGQYCVLAGSQLAVAAGWWVWTVDVKCILGVPYITCMDSGGTTAIGIVRPAADNYWHCYGGIGYLASGTPIMGLWLSAGTTATFQFRLRNYQLKFFQTRAGAEDFLRGGVYAV